MFFHSAFDFVPGLPEAPCNFFVCACARAHVHIKVGIHVNACLMRPKRFVRALVLPACPLDSRTPTQAHAQAHTNEHTNLLALHPLFLDGLFLLSNHSVTVGIWVGRQRCVSHSVTVVTWVVAEVGKRRSNL